MSEPTRDGCGLWALMVAIAIGVFAAFTVEVTIPTDTPTATATVEILAITTVIPQESGETDTYFVIENNQISYTYWPNEGTPCYYAVSGQVLDLNGEPFTDFVVNIKMVDIEGVVPEGPGYAFPGEGGFAEGPSGWSSFLPQWQVSYEIWLTDEIGGQELSPHVIVPSRDCDQNRAIVNFVQVHPIL